MPLWLASTKPDGHRKRCQMHKYLYRHMDSFQQFAFCALAAIVIAALITSALHALMSIQAVD